MSIELPPSMVANSLARIVVPLAGTKTIAWIVPPSVKTRVGVTAPRCVASSTATCVPYATYSWLPGAMARADGRSIWPVESVITPDGPKLCVVDGNDHVRGYTLIAFECELATKMFDPLTTTSLASTKPVSDPNDRSGATFPLLVPLNVDTRPHEGSTTQISMVGVTLTSLLD